MPNWYTRAPVDVTDPNTLLGRPIMRGSDANRPAENDLQRVQWLMTTGEMNLITDSTYINTGATTVAMDAADYRDQTVLSILDDCAQASGKNYFVFRNENLATPEGEALVIRQPRRLGFRPPENRPEPLFLPGSGDQSATKTDDPEAA